MGMVKNLLFLCAVVFVSQICLADEQSEFEFPLDSIRRTGLSKAEKRVFLQQHNLYRGEAGSSAVMPYLRWSTQLETIAMNISKACGNYYHPEVGYGHNVFYQAVELYDGTDIVKEFDRWCAENAVNDWVSNRNRYDPVANTCETGYDCSPYLQVVQSTAIYIGCDVAACGRYKNSPSGSDDGTDGYILTCVYDGVDTRNPLAAALPAFKPSATSCSGCPDIFGVSVWCENNLCRTAPSFCLGVTCPEGVRLDTDFCDCDCEPGLEEDMYCGEPQGMPLACLRAVAVERAKPCWIATGILLAAYFLL